MAETDIRDGAIWVRQNKTSAKLRLATVSELKIIPDRMLARKAQHNVRTLTLLCGRRAKTEHRVIRIASALTLVRDGFPQCAR